MPIVNIRHFAPPDPSRIAPMLAEIQRGGGQALDCAPDNLWVLFDELPAGRYVQAADPAQSPPIVTIQATAGRTEAQKTALARAVTAAVARGLGVPASRVWLHYQELAPREIWWDDRWSG